MVAMMLVPDGRDRRSTRIVGDLEESGGAVEDRGVPLDMEGEDRRADHDDEVMFTQRVRKLPRRGVQEACELRMTLGEGTARRKRTGPDGGPGFLRHPHHQIDGLGAVDTGADDEGRALALRQRGHESPHCGRIGPKLAADLARLDRLRGTRPVVDRDRDERRPAGRLHRDVIGARDRRRHVLRPRRLDAEFHVGLRKFRRALGIEESLQRQDRAGLLAGDDHERRLVAIGGEDIAERMADTGRGMKVDETGVAGRLRIAIGHADDGGFLQAEHVVDVVGPVAEERQFGRAGIAEDLFDAERAQQAEGGVLDGSGGGGFGWLAGRHCGSQS